MNPTPPERRAVNEMLAVGELLRQYDGERLAAREIQRNGDLNSLMAKIADRVRAEPLHRAANRMLGLAEQEAEGFSLAKVIHAQVERDWSKAGLERSISDAITAQSGSVPSGAFVPLAQLIGQQRDFNVGTATEAGNLVGGALGPIQDPLRAASVLAGLGATVVVGQRETLTLPRFANADGPTGWLSEVASAPSLDATTASTVLTPRTTRVQLTVSRQFLAQNPKEGDAAIKRYLVTALLQQLEDAALNSDGTSDSPLGVRATPGISTIVGGADGAQLAWSHLIDLEEAPAALNAPGEASAGFVVNPVTRAWLRGKQRAAGLPFCWDDNGDRNLLGKRVGVTSVLPQNLDKGASVNVCSSVVFSSNWQDLWLTWHGPLAVDLLVDRFTQAPSGRIVITASMLVGVGVAKPASFAKMDDALTA